MGKLVASEFITLDGVIEDPGGQHGGRGGWAFQFERGQVGDKFKLDELQAADAQLLGRVTYDGFAAAWPHMDQDEFGQKMNSMPKYVVSSTLTDPEWTNTTVIAPDLAREIPALKERHEGDLLIAGSGQLVRALLTLNLLDELRLMVFPVVLGGGQRLFGDAAEGRKLRLTETSQAGDCALLQFARAV